MLQKVKWSRQILFLLSTVLLAIYYSSSSDVISGGDSGELVAEGCILGTAHPPGYPLYTLIIFLLKYIPYRTIAFRVNIFSAVSGSLASFLIGDTIDLLSESRVNSLPYGSILSLILFAFSPLSWQYSVTAEVFALNALFAASLLHLTALFCRFRNPSIALLGSFICGLALCNQHTIVLFEAPLILWILWLLRNHLRARPLTVLHFGLCFILGLSFYIYLPLAQLMNPRPGSWGEVTTVGGFLHHFLRRDYGTFRLFSGSAGKNTEGVVERTVAYFQDVLSVQGLYIAPVLALVGVLSSRTDWATDDAPVVDNNQEKSTQPLPVNAAATSESVRGVGRGLRERRLRSGASRLDVALAAPDSRADGIRIEAVSLFGLSPYVNPDETRYLPIVFAATLAFYLIVFHSLANLPLVDKLLFGVHQVLVSSSETVRIPYKIRRFWIQPNVLLFVLCGVGYNYLVKLLLAAFAVSRGSSIKTGSAVAKRARSASRRANEHSADDPDQPPDHINGAGRSGGIVGTVALILALAAGGTQYFKWREVSDQSRATHFRDYARALLDPLPQSSLLMINYDMQWTAIRYLQQCEGYRSDVTAINLSMMTYHWFKHKHHLYPQLRFPGTYHGSPNSVDVARKGAFTMYDFVTQNIKHMDIFLSGKFSFQDQKFNEHFDLMPLGLVSQIRSVKQLPSSSEYAQIVFTSWQNVLSHLPVLPNTDKYPESTWEWTIGRDFKDRLIDTSAYFLQSAIASAAQDPQSLVDAIYWLEISLLYETSIHTPSTPSVGLLKNIGLGHVHLVQSKAKELTSGSPLSLLPPRTDVFNALDTIGWPVQSKRKDPKFKSWKDWSANRFLFAWGEFLRRPEAKQDPQYNTIKGMYETAVSSTNNSPAKGKPSP